MTHIPKKKMKLQNVLILVLIAFILVNLGIMQIIKRVQVGAQSGTTIGGNNKPISTDANFYSTCMASSPSEVTIDNKSSAALSVNQTRIDATNFKANFNTTTQIAPQFRGVSVESWGRSVTIEQTIGTSKSNFEVGQKDTYSKNITITPGGKASYRAMVDFCWRTTEYPIASGNTAPVIKYYKKTNYPTNTIIINNPTDTTRPPTQEDVDAPPNPADQESTTESGDNQCTEQCTQHYGLNPFTWASSAMQNAICEMQCSVVNGLTTFIAFMIREMMLPALGIH